MGNTISKIKTGMPNMPMSRHNNNRDIETTCDIGTVQTLQMKVMNGNSIFDCTRWASVVRIGAMPVPTFGRLKYKMYHRFVKMEDIMPSFSAFLEGKPYTGSTLTYIPQCMPFLSFGDISRYILSFSGLPNFQSLSDGPFTYYKVFRAVPAVDPDVYPEEVLGKFRLYPLSADDVDDIEIDGYESFYDAVYNFYDVSLEYDRNISSDSDFFKSFIDDITIENADYVIRCDAESFDNVYYICFRLTSHGKALVKHLNAIGWKFDITNSSRRLAIPYLVGLYKCYFDMMMPAKDYNSPRTWDMTPAYKLMHWFPDHNKYTFDHYDPSGAESSGS